MYRLKKVMESGIFSKQGTTQAKTNLFWIMQLVRNVSKNNEHYIPGTIT